MEEKMYTVNEVAEILKVNHPESVRRYIRQGQLRVAELGSGRRGHLIAESELNRFIRARDEKRPAWQKKLWADPSYDMDVDVFIEDGVVIDEYITQLRKTIGILTLKLNYWEGIKSVLEGP